MASGGNRTPSIDNAEHIGPNDTGDNIEAKRVASYIWDGSAWIRATAASSGGATEYTSGDATTANPVGGIPVFDNAGTITAVSDVNPLPVDATVNATVDLGDKNIGNATANTQRVVLASDQPVIPINDNSGSLTVDDGGSSLTVDATSLPLPTGAATSANQSTANSSLSTIAGDTTSLDSKIVSDTSNDLDSGAGTDTVKVQGIAVAASGGHAVITGDTTNGLDVDVTRVSGTVTVDGSGVTQPISASSLPLPSGAATAANQQTDALTDTELRATPVVVDLGANNDVTVTSGTITANLGATDNAVLDDIAANQTDNSQKTQIVDASGNAVTVTGNKLDVNATASLAGTTLPIASATEAVGVAIVDSSGNQISSFGGGTQYTEGDTDATFTGTMSLVEGAANAATTLKQPTTPTDTQPISAASLPLPTGAATAANQTTANSSLSSIVTALAGTLTVDASGTAVPITDNGGSITVDGTFWQATQPISAASLPLPSGAATAANQTTLTGRFPATAAAADNTANPSVSKMGSYGFVYDGTTWDRMRGDSTDGVLVNLGTNNDVSVTGTVTVDGSGVTQPVSASSLPLPTGAATAANQQTDALTDTELRATPVVVDLGANNDVTVTGTVTVDGSGVTQPVSASSLPLPSGAATAANQSTANSSLSTIATNTSRGSSATLSNVSGSATSVTLLSSNASRLEATITNDSTADLYVKLGTTASTTSYTVKLGQDESYVTDKYTGRIDGIFSSATGAARITEVT